MVPPRCMQFESGAYETHGFSDSDPAGRRLSGKTAAMRCGAQRSSQTWQGRKSSRVASGRLRMVQ